VRGIATVAVALACAAAAPIATGHISVLPEEAVVRESTEFTIRVPSEGGLTTNSVRVVFPTQVTVYAISDAPGWTTQVLRRSDGRIRGVQWTGGAIAPDRYADFRVLGTPFEEGVTVWRSEQGTTNGTTKKWTGPVETGDSVAPETGPDRPGPAAAVTVGAARAAATGGGNGTSAWPGVIGIALGALALVGVGLLWASRPATLPPDGPEDGPGR
jgi:uncharacterized protein YcnI